MSGCASHLVLEGGNAEWSVSLRVRFGHCLQLVVTLHSSDQRARKQGTGELEESLCILS